MNQKICEKVKAIDYMLYCVTYFYLTKVPLEVAPLEEFLNEIVGGVWSQQNL
jgi:hypothetical protein